MCLSMNGGRKRFRCSHERLFCTWQIQGHAMKRGLHEEVRDAVPLYLFKE